MGALKWLDPVKTETGPSAALWYGAATLSPTVKPAFLRDRGGAGGSTSLLGPDGSVGVKPYELEKWVYRIFDPFGVLLNEHTLTFTHAQGLTHLKELWLNPAGYLPGPIPLQRIVCGSYQPVHYYKAPVSYHTMDGVNVKPGCVTPGLPLTPGYAIPGSTYTKPPLTVPIVELPGPAPGPTMAPFRGPLVPVTARIPRPPIQRVAGMKWIGKPIGLGQTIPWYCWDAAGFKACHGSQWEKAKASCSTDFGPGTDEEKLKALVKQYGSIDGCINARTVDLALANCKPKFCPVPPGEYMGEKPGDYPWKQKSTKTAQLQAEINSWLTSHGLCPIGADGSLGPETCGAAEYYRDNSGFGGALNIAGGVPKTCQASSYTPKKPPCPGGGAAPVTVKTCPEVPCPAGQDCFQQKCVPACPSGYQRNADGNCITKPKPSPPAAGAGLGWLLGIGAATAAIFIGLRAPATPPQPARARLARRGRRRAA